jgi:hypothetical protein
MNVIPDASSPSFRIGLVMAATESQKNTFMSGLFSFSFRNVAARKRMYRTRFMSNSGSYSSFCSNARACGLLSRCWLIVDKLYHT